MTSGFLNGFAHFIFAVEIEDIVDEVKSMLVVVNFGVEAGEIEAVGEILLVNLAKVFIAAVGDELV